MCTVSAYPSGSGRNLNINRNKNINANSIKDTIKNEVVNINEEEVAPIIPEPIPEPCEPEIPEIPEIDDCEDEEPIWIIEDDCEEEPIIEPEDCEEDEYKTAASGAKKLQENKKSATPVPVDETEEVKAARAEFQRAYKAARRSDTVAAVVEETDEVKAARAEFQRVFKEARRATKVAAAKSKSTWFQTTLFCWKHAVANI